MLNSALKPLLNDIKQLMCSSFFRQNSTISSRPSSRPNSNSNTNSWTWNHKQHYYYTTKSNSKTKSKVNKQKKELVSSDTHNTDKRKMADGQGRTSPRPQFGNRFLTDAKQVFEHNAWDNVVWDEEQEQEARKKVQLNSTDMVPDDKKEKYEEEANKFWDDFYTQHQNRFFKDRHWLFTEFPELALGGVGDKCPKKVTEKNSLDAFAHDSQSTSHTNTLCESEPTSNVSLWKSSEDAFSRMGAFPGKDSNLRLFEVGCGVGNTVFPVLQTNNDPGLFVYCCDLSETAIHLVKEHADYSEDRCHAFVCDISEENCLLPMPPNSLDIVILIFVLSAIDPNKMQSVINKLAKLLRPGGMIIFRDYGRHDLAQLRFKNGQCLSDNFYVRGDGTRVYFFTQEEIGDIFCKAGLVKEQNLVDRRLQVNRGKQIKMYRVWIQCKYRKPHKESS